MAVSLLEQRLMPLVEADPHYTPWGPDRIPKVVEALAIEKYEYSPEGIEKASTELLRRCASWPDFTPNRLAFWTGEEFLESQASCSSTQASRIGKNDSEACEACEDTEDADIHSTWASGSRKTSEQFGKDEGVVWQCASDCSDDAVELIQEPSSRGSSDTRTGVLGVLESEQPHNDDIHIGGLHPMYYVDQLRAQATVSIPEGFPITTFLIKNLGRKLTRHGLMQTLDDIGYERSFDYVYMPLVFGTSRNTGIAFVDFINADVAAHFARFVATTNHADVRKWRLALADVQGFQANCEAAMRFRPVRNSAARPLIIER